MMLRGNFFCNIFLFLCRKTLKYTITYMVFKITTNKYSWLFSAYNWLRLF